MACYFITGELGTGKTLIGVKMVLDYLARGKRIATNVDLRLHFLCGPTARSPKVTRLPDRPERKHFEAIGRGQPGKVEKENGLILLDECAVWFNSRDWNSPQRREINALLLMIRKRGWDVVFLVQDFNLVDKQARQSLGQYIGYCQRLDKLKIPFISTLYKLFTGSALELKPLHMCVIKAGSNYHALKVDTIMYRGTDLYSAYNTAQEYEREGETPFYSYAPPALYYKAPDLTRRNIMRLTRIYLKRYSRVFLIVASAAVSAAVTYVAKPFIDAVALPVVAAEQEKQESKLAAYSSITISGYANLPGRGENYTFEIEGQTVRSSELIASGIQVYSRSRCAAVLREPATGKERVVNCG